MAIDKDQYKRITIFFEILVLIAIHTVIYAIMWEKLYMDTIQLPFFRRGNWAMIALYPIIVLIINKILGGFRVATARKMDLVFSQVFSALFTNVVIYFMLVVLIREYPSVIPLLTFFILQMIYIVIWVILVKGINNVIYPPHDMLMIHGGFSPKETVISINKSSDRYNITELVDVNEGMEKVSERIADHDSVIISDIPSSQRNDVLKYCYAHNVRVYMLPKITDIVIRSAEDIHVFDSPFFLSKNYGLSFDQKLIKRIEDIIISGLMIVLLSWLFAIVAIAIKICDGGPIFFRQTRLTRDGKEFMMIKFRSMRVNAEEDGARLAAENDSRITPVGKFIRACHVDELPQVFNVFKGDMSMVGPRPERPEIMEEYIASIPEFEYRLKVKGGMTGYAQVRGKYNTTPYNKLRLDLMYIQNYSLWLDIKCLVLTVKVLFKKENTEGISENQTNALREADPEDTDTIK